VAAVKKTFPYGNQTVTFETGVIARQATAAVMVTGWPEAGAGADETSV